MKTVEFRARMKNRIIRVPDNLSTKLSEDKDFRVILLLDEVKNQEEKDFMKLSKERFLAGYSNSDSIYDNYWNEKAKFPFTDREKHKRRPALILLDTNDSDIIVCRITSKLYDTEFDFEVRNWEKYGLKLPSVIRLHKIASLEKNLVEQTIGIISEKLKQKLKEKFADLLK